MKRSVVSFLAAMAAALLAAMSAFSQTTTMGNYLVNGRPYYVDRGIVRTDGVGVTEDSKGLNYLLLHEAYDGTPLADHYVNGKISGIRGNATAWNRRVTFEVNTASAYTNDRGSLLSYAEPVQLKYVTYLSKKYLAVEIANNSSLTNFSFTGYALGEKLAIVVHDSVSNVLPFTTADAITTFQNVGIGTMTPVTNLTVNGESLLAGTAANLDPAIAANTTLSYLANSSQLLIGWNRSGGNVETDFISNNGSGQASTLGGFAFYLHDNTNAERRLMFLSAKGHGQLILGDNVATGKEGNYMLAVGGDAIMNSLKVKLVANWPDYVFQPSYKLPSFAALQQYIATYQHLPGIPAATELAQQDGVDVGEMNKALLKKVEELTLYILKLNERQEQLEAELKAVKGRQQQ